MEYIHADALGTPIAVTDANQVVIERSEYEPYGKLLNRRLTDGPGFTGHVQDAATGMTYMQQRYYDPGAGRFLSVDPVTADSGTGANLGNLANKNGQLYSFDYGNRLREVPGKETYRYDGLGRRVQTTKIDGSQTLWQYSQCGQMLFSWNGPSSEKAHENVYLGGSLVATIDHDWPSNAVIATKYQHTDALGTPIATTGNAGAFIDKSEYEPYGRLVNRPLTGNPPFFSSCQKWGSGYDERCKAVASPAGTGSAHLGVVMSPPLRFRRSATLKHEDAGYPAASGFRRGVARTLFPSIPENRGHR
ncbi:RHS repeat domain-containing protein [Pseudoxanthomonas sacheonensis]|uniref:RHS repeat domain-containing protein n=1 Tax=Pseudoxanthomonas sacheonensis TaxID=443615 RepID=UPI001FEC8A90|nr:RHS repeat-associated core domain-containing protein [Pseudoxanthomonas sacheonensis]KAF1707785.1 hypothetical protein CSC73_10715 [Pseudoxanthomonas sacheonensis]